MNKPILQATSINKIYYQNKSKLHALTEINLSISSGETLGLAGESGCGKSTLGRLAVGIEKPSIGSIIFHQQDINNVSSQLLKGLRCKMQMIFQDPYTTLNPRMTVEEIIGEGIKIHNLANGEACREIIIDLLLQMDLEASMLDRYPHEFSGGQRQRIGIARALAVNPQFLVCDEPLSALDACSQKHVLQLLLRLKKERQMTYLFISHDMHAMRVIADRIAIMYLGRIVELAPNPLLFNSPAHPYTQALLSAIPIADPAKEKKRMRIILKGELPSPLHPPGGCPFHPRCPKAQAVCKKELPAFQPIAPNHFVACHFPGA